MRDRSRRPTAAIACLARFIVRPAEVFASPAPRMGLALAGAGSLLAGIVLAFVVRPRLGLSPAQTLVAAGWTLGWALARLAILRLALRDDPAPAIRGSWAAGLLPGVIGVTDPLRLVAFGVSAWLTLGALEGAGVARRDARRAVRWAWGAEAAGWLLRWLASGFLYVLATRA